MSIALFCLDPACPSLAQDSICARVRIEILQQLTLEREAIDGRMTFKNGLAGVSLDNINVVVNFTDSARNTVKATSDPNDLAATFFMRLQDGNSIPGSIAGGSSAKINWLIIPANGQVPTIYTCGIVQPDK